MLRIQPKLTSNYPQNTQQVRVSNYKTQLSMAKMDSVSFKGSPYTTRLAPENIELLRKVREFGISSVKENIPPIFKLKNGSKLECKNGLSLVGNIHEDGIGFARENNELSVLYRLVDLEDLKCDGNDTLTVRINNTGGEYRFANFTADSYFEQVQRSKPAEYLKTKDEEQNLIQRALNVLLNG